MLRLFHKHIEKIFQYDTPTVITGNRMFSFSDVTPVPDLSRAGSPRDKRVSCFFSKDFHRYDDNTNIGEVSGQRRKKSLYTYKKFEMR